MAYSFDIQTTFYVSEFGLCYFLLSLFIYTSLCVPYLDPMSYLHLLPVIVYVVRASFIEYGQKAEGFPSAIGAIGRYNGIVFDNSA